MPKDVMIFVKDARYYESEQSLLIVGVEVETRRPITQQATVKDFLTNTGRFSAEEVAAVVSDPDRCRMFAAQLKGRREPFKLVFAGTKTEEDPI